jgi:hypothetical protein
MKSLGLVLLLAATSAGAALAAGPAPRNVDLLRTLGPRLAKVKAATNVPILLPRTLPLGGRYKLYSRGSGGRASYVFSLEGAPNCLGANACFVATFAGKRGGKLPGRPNARLSSGDHAFFRMFSCGGSCSPNSFWFTHRGVLYSWQVKDLLKGERAIMIRMANEAIAAGPR